MKCPMTERKKAYQSVHQIKSTHQEVPITRLTKKKIILLHKQNVHCKSKNACP